jgi:hypothetical protein
MSSSDDDADDIEANFDTRFLVSRSSNVHRATRPRMFVRSSAAAVARNDDHNGDASASTSLHLNVVERKRQSPSSSVSSADNRPVPAVVTYGNPNGSLLPPPGCRRRRRPLPPPLTPAQLAAIAARPRVSLPPARSPMYGKPGAPRLALPETRHRRGLATPVLPLLPPPPSAAAEPLMTAAAAPQSFDLVSLLERREARPFRESTSLADCEPLESLAGIDDVLAALDVDDRDVDENLYIPVVSGDDEDSDDDGVSSVVERLPHTAMFTAKALESLLPLVVAKKIDNEEVLRQAAVAYVDSFVRPDLMDAVATTRMTPAPTEFTAAVPAEWYGGNTLLVGRSNARGQCLFSSVGILLFGGGGDAVALRLRALCIFELVGRWQQYVEWFDFSTVRDMLASLVGAPDDDSRRFGFAWPTTEVLLPLANVLQRRLVIVKRFSKRLRGLDRSSDPHVFLPLLGDEWSHAEPLVIAFDGDHYKPLSCGGTWSIDFNRVAVDFQQASPALVAAFELLHQRGLCGEIRIGCMLDDAAQ